MLILTRRPGEMIAIGDDVKLHILEVDVYRGQVKVGIQAPQNIPIHREEIFFRVQEQNKISAEATVKDMKSALAVYRNKVMNKSA